MRFELCRSIVYQFRSAALFVAGLLFTAFPVPALGDQIATQATGDFLRAPFGESASVGLLPLQDIFTLRPLRVRVSEPDELGPNPRTRWYFLSDQPPPEAPSQDEIFLTEVDPLTIVSPGNSWNSVIPSEALFFDFNVAGNELELRIFRFLGPIARMAFDPPWEHAVPIGKLSAGDYTLSVTQWNFNIPDFNKLLDFDLESFDPEQFDPTTVDPEGLQIQTIESSTSFTVALIPEPATYMLLMLGAFCLAIAAAIGRSRR